MAQSTISKVDELEKLYRLPDAGKVKAFLSERPELLDILLEARPQIEMQFGKGVVVVLRFPRDSWWGDVTARPESRPLHIGIEFTGEPG